MKKDFLRLLSVLFIAMFVFIANLSLDISAVSAVLPSPTYTSIPPTSTPTPVPTATSISVREDNGPANGSWEVSGEESSRTVPMDQVMLPAPHTWEILLSTAIELDLSGTVQLCHPFRGGQFGWTGAIYLKNGSGWLDIPSMTAWMPDEEGRLMVCATVSTSGTYAVFGYAEPYEKKAVEETVSYDLSTVFSLPPVKVTIE